MDKTPQVLIIGAGPVGLTVACELYRHGVPCRVVDAADGPSPWSKASVLHARTLEIFAQMGIADAAVARGQKLRALRAFHRGAGDILHVTMDGLDTPYPYLLGLPQRETEALLLGNLERLGGQVERRLRLVALEQDVRGVTATLHGRDGDHIVRAAFVVACDGSYSMARHLLGLPFEGPVYDEVYLQADAQVRWPGEFPPDEIRAYLGDHGALLCMPTGEPDVLRLQAPLPAVSDIEPNLETFRRVLAERGPAGAEIEGLGWSVAFPVGRRLMPRFRADRVLFAGDAAHQQSPASAQGMNLGIQDAHNLAWKLALCVRGSGRSVLLDSYDEERRAAAAASQARADEVAGLLAPTLTLRQAVNREGREALVRLLAVFSDFRERVARGLAMLDGRYGPGLIVPAALGSLGGGPSTGEPAPDLALGGERLFARLAGARHLLLLFSGGPECADALPLLRRLALDVRSAYPESVAALVVLQRSEGAQGPDEVLDPDGAVHLRFGARSDAFVLCRPDQFVAFRSQPAQPEAEDALFTFLENILGPPALPRTSL